MISMGALWRPRPRPPHSRRVGDVADILQDLIEAHNLEIRRIHGQGHAIDERIDLCP